MIFRKKLQVGDCVIDQYGTIAIVLTLPNRNGNVDAKSIMDDSNFGNIYFMYKPRLK